MSAAWCEGREKWRRHIIDRMCLLIDSIMIGRFLGVDSMAAYGLSNPLLLAFTAIGSMVSAGVQVMCSKSLGSGDQKANNTY